MNIKLLEIEILLKQIERQRNILVLENTKLENANNQALSTKIEFTESKLQSAISLLKEALDKLSN